MRSMNRQTLARLGPKHPETLMSVYCLAHLLANRHRYNGAGVVHKRAVAFCLQPTHYYWQNNRSTIVASCADIPNGRCPAEILITEMSLPIQG
jgi:hypothetical protein